MTGTTVKIGSHTQPHPQTLNTYFFLLDIPCRSGSETAAQGPRPFLATVCTNLLPIHYFASPCGLQREKEKQDTSDSKFFQA